LVIVSDPGAGAKTLLVHWKKYHEEMQKNKVIFVWNKINTILKEIQRYCFNAFSEYRWSQF
jgi:hypothetical protein